MQLFTSIREREGVTVISLEGWLHLGDETRNFRNMVKELVDQGHKSMVLDLGRLEYIDSAGLGSLVASFSTVRNSGGALKLLNMSGKVRSALAMTKLLPVFEAFDDEEKAIASFAPIAGA